jgi:hypothetical protein
MLPVYGYDVHRYGPVTGRSIGYTICFTHNPVYKTCYRSMVTTVRPTVRSPDRTGSPVGRFRKWQVCRSHRTKSVGLYHDTQPNENTFIWTWVLKWGCRRHRTFLRAVAEDRKRKSWQWGNREEDVQENDNTKSPGCCNGPVQEKW